MFYRIESLNYKKVNISVDNHEFIFSALSYILMAIKIYFNNVICLIFRILLYLYVFCPKKTEALKIGMFDVIKNV